MHAGAVARKIQPVMTRYTAYERKMMALLALLACAFLLRGALAYTHDGMALAQELRIGAPPARVWQFIVQPHKRTGWHAGMISILALSENQTGVGARSLVLYRDSGSVSELEETVVKFTPPALWRVRQESDAFVSEIEITLSAEGDGSLIRYREKKVLLGFVDRYLAPWLRWKGQQRLAHSMGRLKLLAERDAAQVNPAVSRRPQNP